MALHSNLTGADVHETKTTIVSGSPITNLLVASAAGVLVVDSTTTPNRLYRALSTAAGDWVLCSPSQVSELSDGAALLSLIDNLVSRIEALEAAT